MLKRLDVHHVRNIKQARIDFDASFNIFSGENGSGKTSILESIFLLTRGQSFRSRELKSLVSYGQDTLTVFGVTQAEDQISIQKSPRKTRIYINQAPCVRSSELAYQLPCLVFYQEIFEIIAQGPHVRRGVMDWGLFYQNPDYAVVMNDYKQVIKQRNILLKQSSHRRQFAPWDEQLIDLAHIIHEHRQAYAEIWFKVFQDYLSQLTSISCELSYHKGWDRHNKHLSLADALHEDFLHDQLKQYTQSGPHQADIIIQSSGHHVKRTLSRGQQKMILIALKLAQAKLLGKPCLFLLDDVSAELDQRHFNQLMDVLSELPGQCFFSAIQPDQFKQHGLHQHANFFRLEEGHVSRET